MAKSTSQTTKTLVKPATGIVEHSFDNIGSISPQNISKPSSSESTSSSSDSSDSK